MIFPCETQWKQKKSLRQNTFCHVSLLLFKSLFLLLFFFVPGIKDGLSLVMKKKIKNSCVQTENKINFGRWFFSSRVKLSDFLFFL